eukprot:Rhum_TRINITY_DN6590_c0_g2::Rhum_TRINITY_DN6590_c0_g2_i1::g.20492::m.20492
MTKEAPSMELLAAAPQLLSSHAEAQGAVMSAMLSEIECWRSLAAAGCLSSAPPEPKRLSVGSKRRASESIDRRDKEKDAKEIARLRDLLVAQEKATQTAEQQLQEAARREEALTQTLKAERAKRASQSQLMGFAAAEEGEARAAAREEEAARLAEKYRVKRRALSQVLDARQEITKLAASHPEVAQRLRPLLQRWRSEYQNLSPADTTVRGTSVRARSVRAGSVRGASVRAPSVMLPGPGPAPTRGQSVCLPPPDTARSKAFTRGFSQLPRKLTYEEGGERGGGFSLQI